MNAAEVRRLAQNLAAARNWPTFPCNARKEPTTPHGFHDAATDPAAIAELWRRWPGPLIGVATGEASDIAVLDCDTYKPDAAAWLAANSCRLPKTLTYETRQGGCHLFYRHTPGLRCSSGVLAPGVDVRADGGYVIHWFSAGYPSLSTRDIEPWPAWLVPKPPPAPEFSVNTKDKTDQSGALSALDAKRQAAFAACMIERMLERVRSAPDGCKHAELLRGSRSIGGVIAMAGIPADVAHQQILDALALNKSKVKDWKAAYRTIRDGLEHGQAHPFLLADRPYDRRAA